MHGKKQGNANKCKTNIDRESEIRERGIIF
jgi:hypothetical protein